MVKDKKGELCGSQITSQGLAQGSSLSPLLFNIYIAYLHNLFTCDTLMIQYADYIVTFSSDNSFQ